MSTSRPRPPSRRILLAGLAGSSVAGVAACSPTPEGTSVASASPPVTTSPSVTPRATLTPTGPPAAATTLGPDLVQATSGRPEVALTFHGAGEATITDGILATLAEHTAFMTVFAIGTWVQADPSIVQRIAAAGHEVGNHTWSHPDLPTMGRAEVESEIRQAKEALIAALGSAGWWFRPSATQWSTETIRTAARAQGYAVCVSYGVDPEDFRDPGAALVRSRTAEQVTPGAIVSLHLGHQGTLDALPGILKDLRDQGLSAVTLSRLFTP